jgi:hypothetical protein
LNKDLITPHLAAAAKLNKADLRQYNCDPSAKPENGKDNWSGSTSFG